MADLIDQYDLVGSMLGGHVRVDRIVAQGGFGAVYRGFHIGFARPVAVKVLHARADHPEAMRAAYHDAFVREARLVFRLSHPAIVRVLDFGVSELPSGDTAPWMVLEWLDGHTLAAALRERELPFTRDEALALLRPAFEALASAHAAGIAHRDVTPSNLFVTEGARGPSARLIDFGVAREMDERDEPSSGRTATQSSFVAFSPAYAAPEQVGRTRTGPWTDVHAMALILSEMLTLQPPYPGHDPVERLGAVLSSTRPTPGARGVDVGAWEPVLSRALSLRPAERFADAGALLAALDDALRGEATTLPAAPTRATVGPSLPITLPAAPTSPRRTGRALAVLVAGAAVAVGLVALFTLTPPRAAPEVAVTRESPPAPAPPPASAASNVARPVEAVPVEQVLAPSVAPATEAVAPHAPREGSHRTRGRRSHDRSTSTPSQGGSVGYIDQYGR